MSIVHVLKSTEHFRGSHQLFQDKWPTQRQQLDRDDTTKIIKFLDNENPFEVNSATHRSFDAGFIARESWNVIMKHN